MDDAADRLFTDPAAVFGAIDVYLFDQLIKGRLRPEMRVLDAGCGGGRNLDFLVRAGYDLRGVDVDPAAVAAARERVVALAPPGSELARTAAARFRVERVEELSLEDASQDAVLCNAVLHFARDGTHFAAMLEQLWRVLRPGGLFFARLATSTGVEDATRPLGGGRHALADGSERFLVTLPELARWTERLGGELLDPLKATNVSGLRCMATWVARRSPKAA